jgi:nicotinamide-nucleotide amidase
MNTLRQLFHGPPQWTLAVAESLTGGRVQSRATAHSGASDFFRGGITAYALESKIRLLGASRREVESTKGVSAQVAEEMALGVCKLFQSDVGLATTGWAEVCAKSGVTIPFAWWALVHHRSRSDIHVESGRIEVPGLTRTDVQERVTDHVLGRLINYLQGAR